MEATTLDRVSDPDAPPTFPDRVLIVDDLDSNVLLLQRVLESAGFSEVRGCLDSSQALAEVAEFKPDLIMLDLHMPEPDGFAILESLRCHEDPRECLPVLVLTADATSPARDKALSLGANDFLTKPFDPTEVVLRARNLLRMRALNRHIDDLLTQTLTGSVEALLETLSLANPTAFARASRIQCIVGDLIDELDPPNRWAIEIAANLSQIGAVTLGAGVAEKLNKGKHLSYDDQSQVDALPTIAADLIESIPGLDDVRSLLRQQRDNFSRRGSHDTETTVPVGSQVLRIAADLDQIEARGLQRREALQVMRTRAGAYSPQIIDLAERLIVDTPEGELQENAPYELRPSELRPGQKVASDIYDSDGILLLGRGHKLTERAVTLLQNAGDRVDGPIYVSV